MENRDIEIIRNLIQYLQNKIDRGVHKIIYNDNLSDEKTVDCINALENVLSELETYKKIDEKLAEHISRRCHYVDAYSNSCDVIEDSCFEDKDCKQCIIDWARRRVENEAKN